MLSILLGSSNARVVLWSIALSVVAGILGSGLMVWLAQLLTRGVSVTWGQILFAGVAIGGTTILDYYAKRSLTRLSSDLVTQVRLRLLRLILGLPYERYEQIGAARLESMVSEEVHTLSQATMLTPVLIIGVVKVIGGAAYFLYLSPAVAGILAVAAALIVVGYQALQYSAYSAVRRWLRLRADGFVAIRNLVDGVRDLSMNVRRRWTYFDGVLIPEIQALHVAWAHSRLGYLAANTFMQSSQMLIVVALLCAIVLGLLEPALVASYAVVVFYMSTAAQAIVAAIPGLSESLAVLGRMQDFGLNSAVAGQRLVESVPAFVSSGAFTVRLQDAGYRYPGATDEAFALGPVDLTFRSGELVFVVGGNGSGKTTLVKMLTGLYPPSHGCITVNERVVDDASRESFRQMFSVIFAESFLLQSIRGYMAAFDTPETLDARAQEILQKLQLQNKVVIRNGVLSSIDLSTGQRKRLALLGAYLEDRPIYVFDEWAASQDPEFREFFYRELLPELRARGKLVIVISHDDAYFDVADRVLRLDFGQIVS